MLPLLQPNSVQPQAQPVDWGLVAPTAVLPLQRPRVQGGLLDVQGSASVNAVSRRSYCWSAPLHPQPGGQHGRAASAAALRLSARFTCSTCAAEPMLTGGPHSGRARHAASGPRGRKASFQTAHATCRVQGLAFCTGMRRAARAAGRPASTLRVPMVWVGVGLGAGMRRRARAARRPAPQCACQQLWVRA